VTVPPSRTRLLKAALASEAPSLFLRREGFPGVIEDTREQQGWAAILASLGVPCERQKLDTGDYSIAQCESRFAIERKSLDDLVRSVTWEAERFNRCVERLAALEFGIIVVECDVGDIARRRYRAPRVQPAVVLDAVARIAAQGVSVLFGTSANHAAYLALRIMRAWWRTHLPESLSA
jgi:ERCC4-type nuclease